MCVDNNNNNNNNNIQHPKSTMTKNILLLVSTVSMGGRGQQVAKQEKAMTLLKAKGIDAEIVDGSDPEQRERRNELFEISQTRGKYPLFFVIDNGSSKNATGTTSTTTYLGDFDDIEYMNDCQQFNRENLLPEPAEEADDVDIEGLVISPENNTEDDAIMEVDDKDNEKQDVSDEVSLDASESSLMAEDLQEEEIQEKRKDSVASVTNEKFNASVYYDTKEEDEVEEEEEPERPKEALHNSQTQKALVDDQELSSVAADENLRLKQELEETKAALKEMQENQKQMQEMINSLQVLVASPTLCSACRQPPEITTPTQRKSKKLDTKATPKSMKVSIEDDAEKKKKKSSMTKDKSSKTKKEESSKTMEESSKTKEKSSKTLREKALARRGKREKLSTSYLDKIGNSSGPKMQIEEFVYNEKGEVIEHNKKSEFVRGRRSPGVVAKASKDRKSDVKDSLKSMMEVVDTPCL
jgi:hypothetical protein